MTLELVLPLAGIILNTVSEISMPNKDLFQVDLTRLAMYHIWLHINKKSVSLLFHTFCLSFFAVVLGQLNGLRWEHWEDLAFCSVLRTDMYSG